MATSWKQPIKKLKRGLEKIANLESGLANLAQQNAQFKAETDAALALLSQQELQSKAETDAKLAELDAGLARMSQQAAQSDIAQDAKFAGLDRQLEQLLALAQQARSDDQQEQAKSRSAMDRLLAAGLVADAIRSQLPAGAPATSYKPAAAAPLDAAFLRLRQVNPRLYPLWKQLFENFRQDSKPAADGFFSHWDQDYVRAFAAYLKLHVSGRILDIGCGALGRPVYLSSFPAQHISGIDPLPARKATDFERVQGFNEFLPWPDAAFNCVVNATSLDHVLSLDVSLRETARVLAPNGRFLVWISSVPNSPAFDDTAAEFKAIDRYHLFHFERSWIEPILEEHFNFVDITVLPQPGFDHVFYSLEPRKLGAR